MDSCEGVAVDWMGNNLYWTEETLGRISVLHLSNASQTRTLVRDFDMHPRSLVVNPKAGVMYWADWSLNAPENGSIQRAWMDGSHRDTFVGTDVDWPTGLTLDLKARRLYWCDVHLKRVESVDFNGSGRKVELEGGLERPYGLALHFGTIYSIDFVNGYVTAYRAGKKENLYLGNAPFYDIKVYNPNLQRGKQNMEHFSRAP